MGEAGACGACQGTGLNESPPEKEGKSLLGFQVSDLTAPQ